MEKQWVISQRCTFPTGGVVVIEKQFPATLSCWVRPSRTVLLHVKAPDVQKGGWGSTETSITKGDCCRVRRVQRCPCGSGLQFQSVKRRWGHPKILSGAKGDRVVNSCPFTHQVALRGGQLLLLLHNSDKIFPQRHCNSLNWNSKMLHLIGHLILYSYAYNCVLSRMK